MENNNEYIKLFMEYESDDMPVVYFYDSGVPSADTGAPCGADQAGPQVR